MRVNAAYGASVVIDVANSELLFTSAVNPSLITIVTFVMKVGLVTYVENPLEFLPNSKKVLISLATLSNGIL